MAVLFCSFIFFLLIKVPVGYAMLAAPLLYTISTERFAFFNVATRFIAGVNSFPLLACGFFLLAGTIMNRGGVTRRIFKVAELLMQQFPGGMGHAVVGASVIFSGMSGSAVAEAGGLGAIELQAMREAGYDDDYSLALIGSGAIIGPIIPPSVPAVIFGVASGVSIGRLFVAGVIPGLLLGILLSFMIVVKSRKTHPGKGFAKRDELWSALKKGFLSLLTPVIILTCIFAGLTTPTEAAAIAVVYSTFLGFYYREIKLSDIPGILIETSQALVPVLFIMSSAGVLGWAATITRVPQNLATFFLATLNNKYILLLFINIFLLICGCFMDNLASILILTPILLPIATQMGVDPVHFGIVLNVNLMIGLMTPPVGMVLYMLSNMSGVPFERLVRASTPFIIAMVGLLAVLTYVPALSTWLPTLVYGTY